MDKFTKYQTFIAVVDEEGLSGAARVLNITPSAVSKQLLALEESVHVQLVERTNRKITPTAAGKAFYSRCKEILNLVSRAEESLTETNQVVSGKLVITLSRSLARSSIFAMLAEFSVLFPEIIFDIKMTDQIEDLQADNIDFAFRLGELNENSRLDASYLTSVKLVFCAHQSYLGKMGYPQSFSDLKNHKLILPKPRNLSDQFRQFLKAKKVDFDWKNCHASDDIECIYQSVNAGLGVGLMIDMPIRSELESGVFVNVFKTELLPSKKLHLVSKVTGFDSNKHQVFKQFMINQFSKSET